MEQLEKTEKTGKTGKSGIDADPCPICYKPVTNSVILECRHELCLLCVMNIMKATKKELCCPLCRKKYREIFIEKKEEKLPSTSNPYIIGIVKRYAHRTDEIVRDKFNTDDFDSYDRIVFHGDEEYRYELFIVRYCEDVKDIIAEDMIERLVRSGLPHETSLQRIRNTSIKAYGYELSNAPCHLQDYNDIIIQKLKSIWHENDSCFFLEIKATNEFNKHFIV